MVIDFTGLNEIRLICKILLLFPSSLVCLRCAGTVLRKLDCQIHKNWSYRRNFWKGPCATSSWISHCRIGHWFGRIVAMVPGLTKEKCVTRFISFCWLFIPRKFVLFPFCLLGIEAAGCDRNGTGVRGGEGGGRGRYTMTCLHSPWSLRHSSINEKVNEQVKDRMNKWREYIIANGWRHKGSKWIISGFMYLLNLSLPSSKSTFSHLFKGKMFTYVSIWVSYENPRSSHCMVL